MRKSKTAHPGRLFPDPYEAAVVLELTIASFDSQSNQVKSDRKQVKIRLPISNKDIDVSQLARSVIEQCKYITEKRLPEVEEVIRQLQGRQRLLFDEEADHIAQGDPCMENLDNYLNQLYGDGSDDEQNTVVIGSEMIMRLCTQMENFETLLQNRVLLSALARLIMEENQERNVEVAFNIIKIFFALSSFVEAIPIISSYRVGSSAMNVLELALCRRNSSSEHQFSLGYGSCQGNSQTNDYLIYASIQLLMNLAKDQDAERKMVRKNLLPLLVQCVSLPSEACVLVSISFIENLSIFEENALLLAAPSMQLIVQLTKLLSIEGTCSEIIDAALGVMFNLSFLEACRKELVGLRCFSFLVNLMVSEHKPTQINAIKLLYHLSGETDAIDQIAETRIVDTALNLVFSDNYLGMEGVLAALIVNITLVREFALQILLQNGVSHLLAHVISRQDNTLAKAIKNLSEWTIQIQHELFDAENLRCKHTVAFPNGLHSYKEKQFWVTHVPSIVRLLCTSFDNQNLVLELLGALHNLSDLDLPYATFWRDTATATMLKNFLEKLLLPGVSPPDIQLNSVLLIRTLCSDEDTALVYVSRSILGSFSRIMKEHRNETDLAMQITLLISQLLCFNRMAEVTLGWEGIIEVLLESFHSSHSELKNTTAQCLKLICDVDRFPDGSLGTFGAIVRKGNFCC